MVELSDLAGDAFLLWLCAVTGLVLALGAFVFRYVQTYDDGDEEDGLLSAAGGYGHSRLMWAFPPKEDKIARQKRWSRVLRNPIPPARIPQRPTLTQLTTQEVLDAFVKLEGKSEVEIGQRKNSSSLDELDEETRQIISRKILRILMEAGPARRLCPITEEEKVWKNMMQQSVMCGGRMQVGLEKSANSGQQWRTGVIQHSLDAEITPEQEDSEENKHCHPLQMDGEVVMNVGRRGVTREMLWHVLAELAGRQISFPCRGRGISQALGVQLQGPPFASQRGDLRMTVDSL